MRFGPLPLAEAAGAVLAHSVEAGGRRLAKGRVLGEADLAALAAAGLGEVVAARLDPGDLGEDAAAARLARALVPDPAAAGLALTLPHAGRVNLKATRHGIVALDAGAITRMNATDPAITLATLAPFTRVVPGLLVGTVKIIPYAVPGAALARAEAALAPEGITAGDRGAPEGGGIAGGIAGGIGGGIGGGPIGVRPVLCRDAGLILTEVPGQAAALNRKGRRAVEARLSGLGMALADCVTVPHETAAIARALGTIGGAMVLILTGSATSDAADDAPAALIAAGGRLDRFGLPVDPGNLLFFGALPAPRASGTDPGAGPAAGARPVIGLPGCARSPALNGADWVLERMACGLVPGPRDVAAMGVGGLLKEIPIRPLPRERAATGPGGEAAGAAAAEAEGAEAEGA